MKPLQILSPSEQVVQHLESQILNGIRSGELPGAKTLSKELGVNHKTVEVALKALESRGLVRSRGSGRNRSIAPLQDDPKRAMKVNILLSDPGDAQHHYMIDIRDKLLQLGHSAVFAGKTLSDMKMDLARIKRLTKREPADAWIVQSANREVLEWFSQQTLPAFALFGRLSNVSIAGAGVLKGPAVEDAVGQLHALGHRRIVMIVPEEHLLPNPSPIPRVFVDALERFGIPAGRYNLPYWEKDTEGFHQRLNSLFQHTPPTALFVSEAALFIAAQQHLARKGIVAPEGVSLICHDPSSSFHWCRPEISHISFDLHPCIRRVLDWAKKVSAGKEDLEQAFAKSVFVRGGTIGPAPAR